MAAKINYLIEKQDSYEIVRDLIVDILKVEIANQVALAIAKRDDPQNPDPSIDPDKWDVKIYAERSNEWEQILAMADSSDYKPIANVWFGNVGYDKATGNVISSQRGDGTFNIDILGFAKAKSNSGGGHDPSDLLSSLESQRATRLIRNILMFNQYKQLGLPQLVDERWCADIRSIQPTEEMDTIQTVWGVRIIMFVNFQEFTQENLPVTLKTIFQKMKTADSSKVLAEIEQTTPEEE